MATAYAPAPLGRGQVGRPSRSPMRRVSLLRAALKPCEFVKKVGCLMAVRCADRLFERKRFCWPACKAINLTSYIGLMGVRSWVPTLFCVSPQSTEAVAGGAGRFRCQSNFHCHRRFELRERHRRAQEAPHDRERLAAETRSRSGLGLLKITAGLWNRASGDQVRT